MKINDVIFQYNTISASGRDGICRLRTFVNSKRQIFLLLTELENNTSASITNSIENINICLQQKGMLSTNATLIEHYESSGFNGQSFDKVSLSEDSNPSKTSWETLSKEQVTLLIM